MVIAIVDVFPRDVTVFSTVLSEDYAYGEYREYLDYPKEQGLIKA